MHRIQTDQINVAMGLVLCRSGTGSVISDRDSNHIIKFKVEKENNMKLALLNTSILTTAGEYHLTDITLDEARNLVKKHRDNLNSAI